MAEKKKKIAEKKSETEPKKELVQEKRHNSNKELYWVIGVMVLMLLVILLIPVISRWNNNFSYQGLSFSKEMFGKIPVYHYYYYLKDKTGQQYQYNLYLRDDPRTNNATVNGKIIYPTAGSIIYLSINATGIVGCPTALRDVASLSGFIAGNFFKVKSGYADQSLAIENNGTYVTCATNPNDMVIALQHSNTTSIIVTNNNNCYTMQIDSCQGLLEAVEKFEVQSIIDAKNASV